MLDSPHVDTGTVPTHPLIRTPDSSAFTAAMRKEQDVMSASALRESRSTNLSFARSLVHRMTENSWRVELQALDIDSHGQGSAVYNIEAEGFSLKFAVFSHMPADSERQGRIADTGFDFFGVLAEGDADPHIFARDHDEFQKHMWKGRTDNTVLGWTVANRSHRLFEHVVEKLTEGGEPHLDVLTEGGGYLIRNAGYYGNGRQGTRAWETLGPENPLGYPYHCDLFTLFLWRCASFDIVEATARARAEHACQLTAAVKRSLGVGNSSGIGTAATLLKWPSWLSAYTTARETVLAYALTKPGPIPAAVVHNVLAELHEQDVEDASTRRGQEQAVMTVCSVLEDIIKNEQTSALATADGSPWKKIWNTAAARVNRHGQECLAAALINSYPEAVEVAVRMIPRAMAIPRATDPRMPAHDLVEIIETRYSWALKIDLTAPSSRERFWYRSEDNGENRRGFRFQDPGVEKESFVDVPGIVQALYTALKSVPGEVLTGEFLLQHPEHSLAVSRVQLANILPYSEIQENFLDRDFLPSDGVKGFLSMLGIERAVPTTSQWVRGVFFRGAPLPEELTGGVRVAAKNARRELV
jgi:hypothetical protein